MRCPGGALDELGTMISFSKPAWFERIIFTSRIPIPLPIVGSNLVKPFSLLIWMTSIITLTVFSVMFFITHRVYKTVLK